MPFHQLAFKLKSRGFHVTSSETGTHHCVTSFQKHIENNRKTWNQCLPYFKAHFEFAESVKMKVYCNVTNSQVIISRALTCMGILPKCVSPDFESWTMTSLQKAQFWSVYTQNQEKLYFTTFSREQINLSNKLCLKFFRYFYWVMSHLLTTRSHWNCTVSQ